MAGKEITDNMLAAFLDGNATLQETMLILRRAATDPQLREIIRLSREVEADLATPAAECCLPLAAVAAGDHGPNICAILCELHVLRSSGMEADTEEMKTAAQEKGWWHPDSGTPLHCIGNILEMKGMKVSRTFHNNADTLGAALRSGVPVIAVVDSNELTSTGAALKQEYLDDMLYGYEPNHAVAVESVEDGFVTYYDPAYAEGCRLRRASLDVFLNAWNDSAEYMVEVINATKFPDLLAA